MHKKSNLKSNILIAGIGGASLGTEILKSLLKTQHYNIFGSDISSYAYGHYQKGFTKTYLINPDNYIEDLLNVSKKEKIEVIIPGGEKPLSLINQAKKNFEKEGIKLAINNDKVIDLCTDKIKTFNYLKKFNIPIPRTELLTNINQLEDLIYPCILKPTKESGGSSHVYFAENKQEASNIFNNLKKEKIALLIQEYINFNDNEYTIGILSLPNRQIVKSIALKKTFPNKLSYVYKKNNQLISSGYSQGEFGSFEDICIQAENIAKSIKSTGPLNIQGRIKNNTLYPFEINPRFSASTYLRTLAGFNEIDIYLQYLINGTINYPSKIKSGYFLRSLSENFIPKEELIK